MSQQPSLERATGPTETPITIGNVTLAPASAKEFKRIIVSSCYNFDFNSLLQGAASSIYKFYKDLVKDDKTSQIDKLNETIQSMQKGISAFIGWQRTFNPSGEPEFMPQNIAPSQINLGYYIWRNASDCCSCFLSNLKALLKLSDDILKERFDLSEEDLSISYENQSAEEEESEFNIATNMVSEEESSLNNNEGSDLRYLLAMRERCRNIFNNVKCKLFIFFGPIDQNEDEFKDIIPDSLLDFSDSQEGFVPYTVPTPLRYAAQTQSILHISEIFSALIQRQMNNCSLQRFSEELKADDFTDTSLGQILAGPYGISAHPTMKSYFRKGEAVISWLSPCCLRSLWLATGNKVLTQRFLPLKKIFEDLGCNISIEYKTGIKCDSLEVTLSYRSKDSAGDLSPYEQLERNEKTIITEHKAKETFTFFLGFSDRTPADVNEGFEILINDFSTAFFQHTDHPDAIRDFKEYRSDDSYFESLDNDRFASNSTEPDLFNEDFETLTSIDIEYFKDQEKRQRIAKAIDELLSFNPLTQVQSLTISDDDVSAIFISPIGLNPDKKNLATKVSIPLAAFSSQNFMDRLHLLFDQTVVTNLHFCWTTHEAVQEVEEQLDALLGMKESVCAKTPSEKPYYLSLRPSNNNPNIMFCIVGIDESTPLAFAQYDRRSQHFMGRHIPIEFYNQLVGKMHKILGVGEEKGLINKENYSDPCFSEIFFSTLRQEHIVISDSLKVVFLTMFERFKRTNAEAQASNILKLIDDIFLHTPSLSVEQLSNGDLFLSPLKSLYIFPAFSQIKGN